MKLIPNLFLPLFLLSSYLSCSEYNRIYHADKPFKDAKHHWRYFYKMDQGAINSEEAKQALDVINNDLVNNARMKISVSETETDIQLIVNEVDESNIDCGQEQILLPLKMITMPKHQESFTTPAYKSFYKKLFIKRLREIARKARKIRPDEYYSFKEKMLFDWYYEIKPTIQTELAKHLADEIADVITDHLPIPQYVPTEIQTLLQQHETNLEKVESINKTTQTIMPLLEYSQLKNPNNKQKREFKKQYKYALDSIYEELGYA